MINKMLLHDSIVYFAQFACLACLNRLTGAIYYATDTHLGLIDHVQENLLRILYIILKKALLIYKLASINI